MNTFIKRISVYLVAALVSVGATYGTYKYLEKAKPYSVADSTYNYGNKFDQDDITLANYTADGYPDFTEVAEKAVHAVVHIKSVTKVEPSAQRRSANPFFDYFFGPGQGGGGEYYEPQPRVGSGSGVIISNDGYIITNNHVIDNATELEVTLNDNQKFNAKVIGADPDTDIALIKIEGKDFSYIPFGDSDKLKLGEWVIAVGNPFNLTSTVTKGIVSAKARGNIAGRGSINSIQSFIQTDAAINPGNSGGALLNTHGQLVGINTAIYSQTGNFAGYGFAVPISIAGKVVADIKEFGTVQRAMLGTSIMNITDAKEMDPKMGRDQASKTEMERIQQLAKDIKLTEGVFVGGFAEKSPAQQVGIKEGDVITAINSIKTPSTSMLQEQISRFRPGDKVKVDIDRYGSKLSFDVILKNTEGTTTIVKKTDGIALAGVAFKELSEEQKKKYNITYGVEVADADRGGFFAQKGINKGFIIQEMNNTPIRSVSEAEQIVVKAGNSKDKVVFIKGITPAGKTVFIVVEFEKE